MVMMSQMKWIHEPVVDKSSRIWFKRGSVVPQKSDEGWRRLFPRTGTIPPAQGGLPKTGATGTSPSDEATSLATA